MAEDLKEGAALTDKVLNEHFGRNPDYLGGDDPRLFVLTYNNGSWNFKELLNKLMFDLKSLAQKSTLKVISSNQSKKNKNSPTSEAENYFGEFMCLLA